MKIFRCVLLLLAGGPTVLFAADPPARLKRADSFLGIHFDFHARPDNPEVGKATTRAMIDNIIDLVKPDFLQIDCKGHPGYSSYPTKVGRPVSAFVGDPLRMWRDVTAARGVALYMHYSGVFDSHAAKSPGWAALNADNKLNTQATSFWGPYAKELLIPQLRELAGDYGVDGVWVDGECWAAVVDYSPAAIEEFQKTTGFTTVPRGQGEPHWLEFLEFHRNAFRRYLRNYVAEVNRTHPAFQICSNWAFTDHMPEPVTAPVTFLSGDYDPNNSVNSARLSARFIAQQGKPWDLMAWSFAIKETSGPDQKVQKSAVQLKREAAIVLAQGGGFQAYFKQKPDGSIYDEEMPTMADVAAFCRARQAVVHHSKSVPQVAVLLSKEDQYHRNNRLFSRSLSRVSGALQALLESQHSVDVVGEHHLTDRLAEYPLVVVPECDYLDPAFRAQLVTYVHHGGNLLLVGPGSANLFARELDITIDSQLKPLAPVRLSQGGVDTEITTRWQTITFGKSARTLGELRDVNSPDATVVPAASIATHGRGRIAAIYFNASQTYLKDQPAGLRDFFAAVVRDLFPHPLVEVKGTHDVDVTIARNHGKLLVHLINTSGPHATQSIQETVAPLGSFDIAIRLPQQPTSVTLEPGAQSLPFQYRDGRVHLTVPSVEIYRIVSVKEQ